MRNISRTCGQVEEPRRLSPDPHWGRWYILAVDTSGLFEWACLGVNGRVGHIRPSWRSFIFRHTLFFTIPFFSPYPFFRHTLFFAIPFFRHTLFSPYPFLASWRILGPWAPPGPSAPSDSLPCLPPWVRTRVGRSCPLHPLRQTDGQVAASRSLEGGGWAGHVHAGGF